MSPLVYGVLVGFLAGVVTMLPVRRRPSSARHVRTAPLPKKARRVRTAPMRSAARPPVLKSIVTALLLLDAKGVYAGLVGSSDPTPQEPLLHHTTSA